MTNQEVAAVERVHAETVSKRRRRFAVDRLVRLRDATGPWAARTIANVGSHRRTHSQRRNSLVNQPVFVLFVPTISNPTREGFEAVALSINPLPVGWVEPIDVGHGLLFLASDEARYITGAALPIDAGSVVK
jgi:hypothetical protein